MNESSQESGFDWASFLSILGIILGTLIVIVIFVLLLYTLYVWLGPWIASILVVLLLVGAFYAAYRLFWQRLGSESERETLPGEHSSDGE